MADYLQREQAPLTSGQWTALDEAVVQTARTMLVGRRFMALVAPLGAGVEAVPSDTLGGGAAGMVDLLGNAEEVAIRVERRRYLPLALIYKDFWVHWRDLESNRQLGIPLDTSRAAGAAAACAVAEDRLIFEGDPGLGIAGLRTVEGRLARAIGDWGAAGRAFDDVVEGVRLLTENGFTGPMRWQSVRASSRSSIASTTTRACWRSSRSRSWRAAASIRRASCRRRARCW